MKTTLIVMAAGMGSRYGGLKQMDSFGPNGESILEYSIHDAIKAGFDEVVLIIKREMEDLFREKVGKKIEEKINTVYVYQDIYDIPEGFIVPETRVKPWGTGHAVYSARNVVKNPFAVINADDFYGGQAFRLIQSYLADDYESYRYCMVGYVLKNTLTEHGHVARGICTLNDNGYLQKVVERTKIKVFYDGPKYIDENSNWIEINPDSIVSMNMWGFTPDFFEKLSEKFIIFLSDHEDNLESCEFYLPFAVDELISSKVAEVKVLKTPDLWYGVTYSEDKPKVKESIQKLINKGLYPEKL